MSATRAHVCAGGITKVGAGLEAQNRCAEWKIRCERKGGQMLIDMAERGERRGDGRKRLHDETVSLEDLGIDKTQSHRWQLLIRMDEAEFEAELAACIEAGNELTSTLMYSLGETDRPRRDVRRCPALRV